MDLILGILGVLQITSFPGLIIHKFLKLRGNLIDKILIIFSFSLMLNYCLIFILSLLGIYTRMILSVIILGEVITIIWLYRKDLNLPISDPLNSAWDSLTDSLNFIFPKRQNTDDTSTIYYFLIIPFLLLSIKYIGWAINLFIQNIWTIFSSWDAVVSWNRWAITWASGQIPIDSRFYPQLIPINWSITYVLLGDTSLQFFAKNIMPLFALLMLIGLLNISIQTKEYYFFISLPLLALLLKKFLGDGVFNGYVDIAVAFFTFMTIYFLIKTQNISDNEQHKRILIVGVIFSAGAALTKQTGVYIALCYPILAYINTKSSNISLSKKWIKSIIWWLIIISTIWISWYVAKEIQILLGLDLPSINALISISSNNYNNVSIFQQILIAMGQFGKYAFLFILIGLAFPLMNSFYKKLTLLIAPYPLLWAWMAGYDTRNLAIFLPIFALIAGYSIDALIIKSLEISKRMKILLLPAYVPIALACAALLYLNVTISPQSLHQAQNLLQKQNFSPTKNQMLYDLIEANGPRTRILTNYPMEYLPDLQEYQVRFNFQDYDIFLAHIRNPDIGYMLLPNSIDSKVRDYINIEIESKNFEVVSTNKEWKPYTLIKISDK